VPNNILLRKQLEEEAEKFWKMYVYNKLLEIDKEYAWEIHPNNLQYVIRALEIKLTTGKSKKDFRTEKKLKYKTLFLTPYDGDRQSLYTNINLRVENMFCNWFVEEVESLLKNWYKKTDVWLQTIGYKEIIEYLEWTITYEHCIDTVKQLNRNYAKRQLTWFSKYEWIH
jgi:tRNA dimethylallyltransferase